MHNVAPDNREMSSVAPTPPSTLLVQLRGAHDALLQEMANLEQVTRGPLPELARFAASRWRLSQASLRRRSLSARVVQQLAGRVEGPERENLAAFQQADRGMMQRSAEHVRNWTNEAIVQKWASYCEASRLIRQHMDAHVSLERQLLYPMLERLAAGGR